MKKLLFFLITYSLSLIPFLCNAQNPSYQQKLYWTCKVWGFVKYFHSNVSVCGVNWDSVLIADLPLVKNSVTKNDFNNALDTMLNAAGTMALASTPPCDTIPPELSRNLKTAWLNDTSIFRNDVIATLDTINNNFRPHSECWVEVNNPNQADGGWLKFIGGDSLILYIDDYTNYADEWQRLLQLFSHWNIVNYFNPYNYIQNQPWDSSLYQNIINIDTAHNDAAFYTAFIKLTHYMNDEHVDGTTSDTYCYSPFSGYWSPDIVLKYIPGKYVVVKSGVPSLKNGDEIISVDGLTMKQWEDSLSPYLSYGDSASFYSLMEGSILQGEQSSIINIAYYDSLNNIDTITTYREDIRPWLSYFPSDSLANIQWKYWSNCNIGYINVGNMKDVGSDVSDMFAALQNTNAIIFDIRNYPASNAVFDLEDEYLYPTGYTPIAKVLSPDVTYPGTYSLGYAYAGYGNSNPYKGKLIILFNDETESEAEYAAMSLGELPNSIKIGSQTDGTDGNVTYYQLNLNIHTGFTSLGWFYPNGDSTERVGIIPDILVYPTQAGIRAGRDEELEKALEVAGCPLSVPELKAKSEEVRVYPNPSNGVFTVSFSHAELVSASHNEIKIYNILGENIFNATLKQVQGDNTIDLTDQPNGVYFYRVLTSNGEQESNGKIIIIR